MKIDDISTDTQVHLIGIGGVSMAALAEVLHQKGAKVTGSDGVASAAVSHLRSIGIPIYIGHNARQVGKKVACIIRSAAIRDDNPEIVEARRREIPVFERAQAWGAIMRQYENALCIAGTHGKTTTTAMCAQIFLAAMRDPTVMLGGVLPSIGAGHCMGSGDTIILESCEYCNSFHHFFPTVAILLNIDEDHMDFFGSIDDIKQSFSTFLTKLPEDGIVYVCADDPIACEVAAPFPHFTYGLEQGDIYAKNLVWKKGFPTFTLIYRGMRMEKITLKVPGEHNVRNALAAAATALYLGVDIADVVRGLGEFRGAGRRFEHKGRYQGVDIIDDYAHHPTEIAALLQSVRKLEYNRVYCVFQPHTYSRTKAFFDDFVKVLSQGEPIILLDIYAAREEDTGDISSEMLYDRVLGSRYFKTQEEAIEHLKKFVQQGDLILTVGAGDVYKLGEAMLR